MDKKIIKLKIGIFNDLGKYAILKSSRYPESNGNWEKHGRVYNLRGLIGILNSDKETHYYAEEVLKGVIETELRRQIPRSKAAKVEMILKQIIFENE